MQLTLRDDLPFVTVLVAYRSAEIEVVDVLVDTGSASTILAADAVAAIGIVPEKMTSCVCFVVSAEQRSCLRGALIMFRSDRAGWRHSPLKWAEWTTDSRSTGSSAWTS